MHLPKDPKEKLPPWARFACWMAAALLIWWLVENVYLVDLLRAE